MIAVTFTIVLSGILFIKYSLILHHHQRAIKYIFSQLNWKELKNIYLNDYTYYEHLLNPFVWTYEQTFKGLES